jgi:hypothetical protein
MSAAPPIATGNSSNAVCREVPAADVSRCNKIIIPEKELQLTR